VELGCFDGRAVGFLPRELTRYVGYDANWEGGLDQAIATFSGRPAFEFRRVTGPKDLEQTERFDAGICLETFEHLPVAQVDTFIDWLANVVTDKLFVTIPNEKHVAFLGKYSYHRWKGGGQRFSPTEVVGSLVGKMEWVQRSDHKGFDYQHLVRQVSRRFRVEEVVGLPVRALPHIVSPTIALVATRSIPIER
jgi:cyclopropane fatty-acyl-phospholipid synthase-like methyltransferase